MICNTIPIFGAMDIDYRMRMKLLKSRGDVKITEQTPFKRFNNAMTTKMRMIRTATTINKVNL